MISYLGQCNPLLVGKHPQFADFRMLSVSIPFRIESRLSDMKLSHWESLLLPLVLVLTGVIVLASADLGFVSLDRVKDLWPGAIILVGLADLFCDESPRRSQNE
jgi:hypothetical protein